MSEQLRWKLSRPKQGREKEKKKKNIAAAQAQMWTHKTDKVGQSRIGEEREKQNNVVSHATKIGVADVGDFFQARCNLLSSKG